MINGEGWLAGKRKCKLTVIPVKGWKHSLSLEITDGRYLMDPEKSIQQSVEKLYSVI